MTKKTIAYIRSNSIFDDSRATKEIMAISELGFDVVVLAWDRFGDGIEKCNNVFKSYSNVSFLMFNCEAKNGIGLKGITKLFKWFKWLNKQLCSLKDNLVAIHSCDLDTGICARKFSKKHNIKYIYDIYDYYVDTHKVPLFLKWFIERKEISVINQSWVTIICTSERLQQISKSRPNKVEVIYNSPDVSNLKIETKNLIYDYVYCGGLTKKRLVDQILMNYKFNSDLKFLFAGNGEKEIVELAKKLALEFENFVFVGSIEYSQVLKYESESLCLSAIYDPNYRNHRLCAPNKFYESLGLGKPIIVCKNTGIDKIVDDYGIGKSINFNVSEFYAGIRDFKANSSYSKRASNVGINLFKTTYDWALMKKKIESIYKSL
jgi:glycosyltransferase involved in cell wall biosynthesis